MHPGLVEQRRASVPEIAYPAELPITQRRQEILDTIRDNQVVVIAGETGSGKSTQIPKLCLELGRGVEAMIGHTQPRRLAARSIASRVADELGTTVGELVGYTVRFTDEVSDCTLVKAMTDGILLAELQRDPDLRRYDTIIIDEAHERTLTIDFLLGYLRRLVERRDDLKVIITSATIDTEKFAAHFAGPSGEPAPIIEVSGRSFPVEVRFQPLGDPDDVDGPILDVPEGIERLLHPAAGHTRRHPLLPARRTRDSRGPGSPEQDDERGRSTAPVRPPLPRRTATDLSAAPWPANHPVHQCG